MQPDAGQVIVPRVDACGRFHEIRTHTPRGARSWSTHAVDKFRSVPCVVQEDRRTAGSGAAPARGASVHMQGGRDGTHTRHVPDGANERTRVKADGQMGGGDGGGLH